MPLHVCCSPIGNIKDITLRTLETIKTSDIILCEDTRFTDKLLHLHNINRKGLYIYNDNNSEDSIKRFLPMLIEGKTIALISDAGCPTISDPGYKIISKCYEHGIQVIAEPGPSAVITGLVLSNFPPYPFCFGGFFSKKAFDQFIDLKMTLIFFESPNRLVKTLEFLDGAFTNYSDRKIAVLREMTKLYQEVKIGTSKELIEYYSSHPPKGEITICIDKGTIKQENEDDILKKLNDLIQQYGVKEATKILSKQINMPSKDLYKLALKHT